VRVRVRVCACVSTCVRVRVCAYVHVQAIVCMHMSKFNASACMRVNAWES
jgi:hypothetical protein